MKSVIRNSLATLSLLDRSRALAARAELLLYVCLGFIRRGGRPAHRPRVRGPNELRGLFAARLQVDAAPIVHVAWASAYHHLLLKRAMQDMLECVGLQAMLRGASRVVIKVNVAGDARSASAVLRRNGISPSDTYGTHPRPVEVLAELALDGGAREVVLVEALYDRKSLFLWGYADMAKRLGLRFVDLNSPAPYSDFIEAPVGPHAHVYASFRLNAILQENDLFVSFAKLKQHHGAGVSLTLKNLLGILPVRFFRHHEQENNRTLLHELPDGMRDLSKVILDVFMARPIGLAVIDGILTTAGSEGPWHTSLAPVRFNAMLAGRDAVAVDSAGAMLMGFDPAAPDMTPPFAGTINYLRRAEALHIGTNQPGRIGYHFADWQRP